MLGFFVFLYLILNLGIGLWASRRIHSTRDFVLAGRNLPLGLAISATFATWFGSESIMGAPAEFLKKGLLGIIEEPFGAALCLLLIGLFYARKFYRMNIITFCDFFRIRFGRRAELLSAILIIPSYFSWIAAQLIAMGIVLKIVLGWEMLPCILLSSTVVITYTVWGGMWSISITDFFQTIMIIVGLVIVAILLYNRLDNPEQLTSQMPADFFNFFPKNTVYDHLHYIAAWITIGLGSIPQQDVFQRVMSAKTERIAVQSSIISSILYITIAMIPLFIGLCAYILYPELASNDLQMIIPDMIMVHTPIFIRILFFGALVSAILSTTSSAVMAPATVFGENILKFFKPDLTDRQLLFAIRVGIVVITVICISLATTRESIFELVAESSAFSLVSLFIPLTAGLYFPWATARGCILSMVAGLSTWLICLQIDTSYPPVIYGLLAGVAGILLGGFENRHDRNSKPNEVSRI